MLHTKTIAAARNCLYYYLDPQDKSSIHKLLFEQFLNECTLKWINLSERKHGINKLILFKEHKLVLLESSHLHIHRRAFLRYRFHFESRKDQELKEGKQL